MKRIGSVEGKINLMGFPTSERKETMHIPARKKKSSNDVIYLTNQPQNNSQFTDRLLQ